jgi:hypothetical protein
MASEPLEVQDAVINVHEVIIGGMRQIGRGGVFICLALT